jgi:hypothetical protein
MSMALTRPTNLVADGNTQVVMAALENAAACTIAARIASCEPMREPLVRPTFGHAHLTLGDMEVWPGQVAIYTLLAQVGKLFQVGERSAAEGMQRANPQRQKRLRRKRANDNGTD